MTVLQAMVRSSWHWMVWWSHCSLFAAVAVVAAVDPMDIEQRVSCSNFAASAVLIVSRQSIKFKATTNGDNCIKAPQMD